MSDTDQKAYAPIRFSDKFACLPGPWEPRVIAEMNDYQFKAALLEGEFIWHDHAETDETFIVLEGALDIQFRDGVVRLGAGEMFVVPKGVEHRPVAADGAKVVIIEPRGVVNTGAEGGERTVANDQWI
jgi:mannose-6-phosphate isomerase-like protein (cupin superfamily)